MALVGREFKTFDNAMAFARSVNVVVNVNDLPHLPAILKKGITDHVEFYRDLPPGADRGRQELTRARRPRPRRRRQRFLPKKRSGAAGLVSLGMGGGLRRRMTESS